jgi:hypothetical protein
MSNALRRQVLLVDADWVFPIWITDFARPPENTGRAMGPAKYSAVTIVAARECCAAVQELAGRKILAASAPRLPLADCASPSRCQCRFKKLPDRRDVDDDRRYLRNDVHSAWYEGTQRRKSTDRRRED